VLGHSDVAPSRKRDPGEKFPWRLLHDSGVGLWTRPARLTPYGPRLTLGDSGDTVQDLQVLLATFGYGVPLDGQFDATTRDVVTAFQRHYRPELIDGVADAATMATLESLLNLLPQPAPLDAAPHDFHT
jgi:N-acetylmuramoyl-L-alanine amidase